MSNRPTRTASERTDERQLDLARAEGEAYQRAFRHTVEAVANSGDFERAGDFVVAFAQDAAQGMYRMRDGELEWTEPSAENCHLQVGVADAADGRFVPGLSVSAALVSEEGTETEEIGPVDLEFMWHPGVSHYGTNVTVPGDGTYDLRIEIAAPTFARHDSENGDRFAEDVTVTFEDVSVTCGQA